MTRVAIVAMGEMGAAIGGKLVRAGLPVASVLGGRSNETRARADEARVADAGSLDALLADCDLFLSIVPPAQAMALAKAVAVVARRDGRAFTFVDCNAISPAQTREIGALFAGSLVRFVDGGIIGQPPGAKIPRFYRSGPACPALDGLDGLAFDLRDLGPEVGAASGLKMSYAAISKGLNALLTAAALTADRLGLLDAWLAELAASQPDLLRRAETAIPRLPADAGRWTAEMEEIAATFAAVGVPSGFHEGAAQTMSLLAHSPFGAETRRTLDTSRDLRATLRGLSET
ncbi:NAD(P)-dependent oxidoreductase [Polymorphum gilvum]|uniref:Phosphogluconate dehydrogenase, NAD-binding, putative-like protein n=1 Tax=Polymorphum gilvum (strain LMG 25793 / CGMCC 1.9160 / SL003B-26A1) TaxID=991905 RepID=F2IVQ9_POLGS|nr:NAD(P)-dependent oxidoreductase [Polymorphum gilvum]ADZ69166.1 Phosphogluconate dehydrogenase, NAD-binding, putative-like protein [Polymorphum gilvum SL003B-26A1]